MEKRRSFEKACRTFRSWRRWGLTQEWRSGWSRAQSSGSLSPPQKAQRLAGGEGWTYAVHVSSLWNRVRRAVGSRLRAGSGTRVQLSPEGVQSGLQGKWG